jgi:coronin-1B/1C/6
VLDTDFNPFNDHVIASASEDCKVMIWKIPENGLTDHISTPALTLTGHGRKVDGPFVIIGWTRTLFSHSG